MEQPKQILYSPHLGTEIKIAVLLLRLNRTIDDLHTLDMKVNQSVLLIKAMIIKILNRPNSVQEFLLKNWKAIVLTIIAVLGANATVIESLAKVFLGT